MAAYMLTKAGANVALLEAGQMWNAIADGAMLKWPYESPRRGASTPTHHFGEFDACIGGFCPGPEPFTTTPRFGLMLVRAPSFVSRPTPLSGIFPPRGPGPFRSPVLPRSPRR